MAVAAQVTGVAVAAGVAGVLGAAAAAAIGPLTVEEEISSGRLQVSEATALKAKTAAGAWAAVTGAVIGAHATSTFTAGIVETGAAAAVKTVGAIVLGTGVAVGIVGIASIAVGALLLPLIIRNANN
ncbi:MAG TPA: hypothetical protein VLE95_06665 [Chlamydiales bacterium]|nr:hypothetical protein [Chlamydiales bacterium]